MLQGVSCLQGAEPVSPRLQCAAAAVVTFHSASWTAISNDRLI
jgi:hypothetical protein